MPDVEARSRQRGDGEALAGSSPADAGRALGAQPAGAGRAAGSSDGGSGNPSVSLPSSRLGGALLLAGIVAAVVVAVILLTSGGSSHARSTASSGAAATSGAKAGATGSGPKVDQRLTLRSPNAGSSTIAAVEILSESGKRAFYIAAEHLPPSRGFSYVVWLYNSPTSVEPLSKAPAVGSNERLAGGALLPENAGNYHEMLITRETASHPTHPGPVALQGAFSLGG
jgi:hypothetical protein